MRRRGRRCVITWSYDAYKQYFPKITTRVIIYGHVRTHLFLHVGNMIYDEVYKQNLTESNKTCHGS
jgi:hypothetical protein